MAKKTLVLGASLKADRYSNIAIKRLVKNNHEVVAVGLIEGYVASVKVEKGKPDFKEINTITLYLNPIRQEEYYNYVISLQPKRVIFNPGTGNMEFVKILRENNIEVEIACTLVLLSINQY